MFITHAKTDRDVRLPVEMLGKPARMKWQDYCGRLHRQMMEMNAGADIKLTIHLDRAGYESVLQEINTLRNMLTFDKRFKDVELRNCLIAGITLTFDIPEFI